MNTFQIMRNYSDRIVYASKCGNQSQKEFFVYADPNLVGKWQKDPTIPLVDVLESFKIFTVDNRSSQGIALTPSLGQLQDAFGPISETEMIKTILQHGRVSRVKQECGPKGFIA
jgi:ribosome maturation protein Sdo1